MATGGGRQRTGDQVRPRVNKTLVLLGSIQEMAAAAVVLVVGFSAIAAAAPRVTLEVDKQIARVNEVVQVRVTIDTEQGQQIGTDTSYIASDQLPPGAMSTWRVYVTAPRKPLGERKTRALIESGRTD